MTFPLFRKDDPLPAQLATGLDGPTDKDRDIPRRALARFDFRKTLPGFGNGSQKLVQVREGRRD